MLICDKPSPHDAAIFLAGCLSSAANQAATFPIAVEPRHNNIEELYTDLQEAADAVGLTQLEIDLLVALAKGTGKKQLCRRFKTEYRKKFWGTSMDEMFSALSTIRDSALARLRESMGVETTDTVLSSSDLEQVVVQLARRPDTSATLLLRTLRSRGVDVSLSMVRKILRQNKLSTKAERLAASVSE